jgi:3-hydroxymyristoyl/3-hydroxydecanoyl-(acyl carrier protein) dehydratase
MENIPHPTNRESINFGEADINKEEIKKLLPHREPVLFLNKARIINKTVVEGFYSIQGNEFGFNKELESDKKPILLTPVLLEFFNQSCGILISWQIMERENKIGVLVGYNDIIFNQDIINYLNENSKLIGLELKTKVELKKEKSGLYVFQGIIYFLDGDKEVEIASIGSATFSVVDRDQLNS